MSLSTTRIKLFGPGIALGLKKLNELGSNVKFGPNIAQALPYIGDEADFEIIWERIPTTEETFDLVKYLDKIFIDCKCKYTVTTISPAAKDVLSQLEASKEQDIALTFLRLIGPSISQAIEVLNKSVADFPRIKAITGEIIGRYDYALEWIGIPQVSDIVNLIEEMDRILEKTGVIYTVTTKSKLKSLELRQTERIRRPDPMQFVLHRKL